MVMQMESISAAPRTFRGPVSVGGLEPSLVLGEIVHIGRDEGAAAKADPARVHEAGFRRRGTCSGIHAAPAGSPVVLTCDRRDGQVALQRMELREQRPSFRNQLRDRDYSSLLAAGT